MQRDSCEHAVFDHLCTTPESTSQARHAKAHTNKHNIQGITFKNLQPTLRAMARLCQVTNQGGVSHPASVTFEKNCLTAGDGI